MPRKPKQKTRPTKAAPTAIAAYYSGLRRELLKYYKKVQDEIFPILDMYINSGMLIRDALTYQPFQALGLDLAFTGLRREAEALNKLAEPMARKALWTANISHRRQFINSFKESAGIDLRRIVDPRASAVGWLESHKGGLKVEKVVRPQGLGNARIALKTTGLAIDKGVPLTFEAAVQANVNLIKTLEPQHIDRIQDLILKGIESGKDGWSLKKEILRMSDVTDKRAKLIARDQIQKFNSVLTMTRQQAIGVEGYIWRTSNDERVRDSHMEKDGQRFSWNSPPGDTGHPGEDVQCRCTAEPDLTNLLGGVGLV